MPSSAGFAILTSSSFGLRPSAVVVPIADAATDAPTSQWLVREILAGSEAAWQTLIDEYQGRLSAFVRSRLRDSHVVDDVVQETFLGLLRSLPHFDPTRELENYLFTIAAHKIRDQLRKDGRHPMRLLGDYQVHSDAPIEPAAGVRGPSSMLASRERLAGEEQRLTDALRVMLHGWLDDGDYQRVQCIELLLVCGWANKDVAAHLDLTEQQVANYKFQVVERLARNT